MQKPSEKSQKILLKNKVAEFLKKKEAKKIEIKEIKEEKKTQKEISEEEKSVPQVSPIRETVQREPRQRTAKLEQELATVETIRPEKKEEKKISYVSNYNELKNSYTAQTNNPTGTRQYVQRTNQEVNMIRANPLGETAQTRTGITRTFWKNPFADSFQSDDLQRNLFLSRSKQRRILYRLPHARIRTFNSSSSIYRESASRCIWKNKYGY